MDFELYKTHLKRGIDQIPEGAKQTERFSVPRVAVRYEGKNSIVLNFSKIIQKIDRDEKHFLPIFLKSIGTEARSREGGRLFLKGRPKNDVLDRHINDYVNRYVLCKICNKPDTNIIRDGKRSILVCQACGSRTPIDE